MEILGIGPLEFLFILVIALIVLGPRGVVKYSQQAGSFIRKVVQSPAWRSMMDSTQEIKKAQQQFMRDSGLNESIQELERDVRSTVTIPDDFNRTIRNTPGIESERPTTKSLDTKDNQTPIEDQQNNSDDTKS